MAQLWKKPKKLTKKEQLICDRLKTTGRLFKFLREFRHLIFDAQMCEAKFAASDCNACPLKEHCTDASTGRTISIHEQEEMLQALEKFQSTAEGRKMARERVKVEHSLAAICNRNGRKARYSGCRKNEFNLNRAAIIVNLHKALQWAA